MLDLLRAYGIWTIAAAFLASGMYMWGTQVQDSPEKPPQWPSGLSYLYMALGVGCGLLAWYAG